MDIIVKIAALILGTAFLIAVGLYAVPAAGFVAYLAVLALQGRRL